MPDHVHVFRETRELRNKRIAIEAVALAGRIAHWLDKARSGLMVDYDAAADIEGLYRRWEARDVDWVRPGGQALDPDTWLTANEAAAYFDTSPAAVRRWAYRGGITSTELDGRVVYNVGECQAYLAGRQRRPQADPGVSVDTSATV